MKRSPRLSRRSLLRRSSASAALPTLGLALSAAYEPAAAQDADRGGVEEVVVTGSYLRRAEDSSSPLTILTQQELAFTPRSSIAEVLHADPAFNGSDVFTSFGTGMGTSTSAPINLRSLGPRATLVLLNGGRSVNNAQPNRDGVVTFDVNSLMPAIAIERVEVLKDGASALYGTDAVAGVVNFITRNDFEGIELQASWQQTDVGGQNERLVAGLLGHGTETSHVLFAFEQLERDPFDYLSHPDVYAFNQANPQLGANGSPGSFRLIPGQAYNELVPPGRENRLIRDPLCGDPRLGEGTVAGVPGFQGSPANNDQICRLDGRLGRAAISSVDRTSVYARIDHGVAESLDIGMELGFTRSDFQRAAGYAGAAPESLVPASHPANPFGGDVLFRGSILGPAAGPDRTNVFTASSDTWRVALFADGDFAPGSNWRWDTKLTWSVNEAFAQNRGVVPERVANALLGLGGFGCDPNTGTPGVGDCRYYNPFGSQYLASPGDPEHNDPALIDFMTPFAENISRSRLVTATGVITGDIAETRAGEVSVAVGYEFRNEAMKNDFDPLTLAGEFAGNREVPFDANRDSHALFFEFLVPATSTLELQLAGRYEDYGEGIEAVVPKIGMLWDATDNLIVRATYGKSFKAPGLVPTYATSAGLTDTVNVPGIDTLFPRTVTRPNPNLEPEKADAYSAGITWSATDRLTLTVGWWRFDTRDITGQESAQLVVEEYVRTGAHADRLTFDESGVLTDIDLIFDNFSILNTEGFDLSLDWDFDIGRAGALRLATAAAFMTKFDYQIREDQPVVDGLGRTNSNVFADAAPELKANVSLTWQRGAQYARTTVRFIEGMLHSALADDHPLQANQDYVQVDLVYGLTVGASDRPLELRFAVNNVNDERPPIFLGAQLALPQVYDSRGRSFSFGLTKTF
ncbi:MAG TPA: TonB-dependent receptor [Gammaproteobacteria bacterium]